MNYVSGLLLAAAIGVAVAGPALAGVGSGRTLSAAPIRMAAPGTTKTPEKISTSSYSPKAATGKSSLQKLVGEHARAAGVPVALALAVVQVESNFNPRARGHAGEVGLMQIKPATARGIGYKGSLKGLYNPDVNLAWGMKYLAEARRRGDGTVCGTILKYNAGHYAKRMNKTSARYCGKVKSILRKST